MGEAQQVSSPFLRHMLFSALNPQAPRAPCQTSQPASRVQVLADGFAFVSKFPIAEELCLGRQGKKKEEYFVLKYKIKVNLILFQEKKNTPKDEVTKLLQRIILRGLNQTLSSSQLIFRMLCRFPHSRTPFQSVGLLT